MNKTTCLIGLAWKLLSDFRRNVECICNEGVDMTTLPERIARLSRSPISLIHSIASPKPVNIKSESNQLLEGWFLLLEQRQPSWTIILGPSKVASVWIRMLLSCIFESPIACDSQDYSRRRNWKVDFRHVSIKTDALKKNLQMFGLRRTQLIDQNLE